MTDGYRLTQRIQHERRTIRTMRRARKYHATPASTTAASMDAARAIERCQRLRREQQG